MNAIIHHLLCRLAPLPLLLTAVAAHAQVFIPTTLEREWLNEQLPGIVDAGGIMDTLHPGIATLDTATMSYQGMPITELELHGLPYLDALISLRIDIMALVQFTEVTIAGIPPSLRRLNMDLGPSAVTLPEMPVRMDVLDVSMDQGEDVVRSLHVERMPDTLGLLYLSGADTMHWNGTPYAPSVFLESALTGGFHTSSYIVPPVSADVLTITDGYFSSLLDLSNVTVRELYLDGGASGEVRWPNSLDNAYIAGDLQYASLGPWPPDLRVLTIYGWAFCVPWLPESIEILEILTSLECIPNWPPNLLPENCSCPWESPTTTNYCSVLNSACPGSNPGIAGRMFMDVDGDGAFDTGEPPLPLASVMVQPGGNVAGCDAQGYWELGVQPGNYTAAPASSYPYVESYSPAQHPANVPDMGDADTGNDFAATLIPDITDLRVSLYTGPARPGFDNRLFLSCQNYGTIPVDATVTLQFDADQTWVASSTAPTTLSGTTATWTFTGLAIGSTQTLTVDLNTAASIALGTPIEHTLTATSPGADEAPDDNLAVWIDEVVGSYDPNDKLVSPATLTPVEVQSGGHRLEYTIRFQNTGTFLAERVLILDTLPAGLVPESIQFLASSHSCTWSVSDGVLQVMHADIMLPDSISDEANSHGFVRFSIAPSTDLVQGDVVENIAHIVFDFNAPIMTPPATFSVLLPTAIGEADEANFGLQPNPARDRIRIVAPHGLGVPLLFIVQDALGRSSLQGRTDALGGIDIGSLAPGAYMLRVEGSTNGLRFIKE